MTKRRKKTDSRSAKIAEASGLLKRAGKIIDSVVEGEQSEPESPLDRIAKRAYAHALWLYPPDKKKRRQSKKKSKGKSGNA